jgi:hypothetical protein
MSPHQLLDGAATLLGDSLKRQRTSSVERAAAWLARQALEAVVYLRLREHGLGLKPRPFSAQLLCLQGTTKHVELAREAAALWASLSVLTHHQGHELTPTGSDLAALVDRTRRVVDGLLPSSFLMPPGGSP